jgi:hypothetical protein
MIQIEPKYVTFEQAKWLKEKGFGKWSGNIKTTDYCHGKYFHKKPSGYGLVNWKETDILFITGYDNWVNEYPYCDIWTYAPEQHQVVEWLLVNHGIWVSVDKQNYKLFKWRVSNINLRNDAISDLIEKSDFNYDTPQKAYSAAFDYILNNKFGIILK